MQLKLSGHHPDRKADRTSGVPVSLIRIRDPATQFCLPPRAAQDVLDRYLPDDDIVGQHHARPYLIVLMPCKHHFDAAVLPGWAVELRGPLWVPPREGFGITGEVGG